MRDNTQESYFVLDTFVVLTNGLHEPNARVDGDLRVKVLVVAADAFDVTRRPEEICEIFDLRRERRNERIFLHKYSSYFEVITDVKRIQRSWKILLI